MLCVFYHNKKVFFNLREGVQFRVRWRKRVPSSAPTEYPPLRAGQNARGRYLWPRKDKRQQECQGGTEAKVTIQTGGDLRCSLPRSPWTFHSDQPKPRRDHGGTDRELQKREPLMLRESGRNPRPFLSPSSLFSQTPDPKQYHGGGGSRKLQEPTL